MMMMVSDSDCGQQERNNLKYVNVKVNGPPTATVRSIRRTGYVWMQYQLNVTQHQKPACGSVVATTPAHLCL